MQRVFSRRDFNRLKLDKPILSSIELVTVPFDQVFQLKESVPIFVVDISAGGLKFISKCSFKVNYLTIYKIKITLGSKNLVLYGKIIRKNTIPNDNFEYGVLFNFDYNPNE